MPKAESAKRLKVHCRPARQEDTADVLDLTRRIWDGEDYIPYVWQDWLADPQGRLAVAEHEGRVLGLGKLTRLSNEDWWLEGLRVHPEYQGHGIASQLNEYLVEYWLEHGSGTVRLTTSSARLPVHHLCERLSFEKIGEYTPFVAPALEEKSDPAHLKRVTEAEVPEGIAFALHSQTLALSFGLMDLGWQWAPPKEAYLLKTVKSGNAWWWRGREGLLAIYIDEYEMQVNMPILQLVACSLKKLAECLEDYRRLADWLGYAKAVWFPPLISEMAPILEQAGFQRDWEHAMVLYARRHAER
jgi:GNAT superfamily N-acetyltransferase